jgi:hypothetical protein
MCHPPCDTGFQPSKVQKPTVMARSPGGLWTNRGENAVVPRDRAKGKIPERGETQDDQFQAHLCRHGKEIPRPVAAAR